MPTTSGKSPVTLSQKEAVEREIDRRCKATGVTREQLYNIVPSVALRATEYKEGSKWQTPNTERGEK